MRTGEMWRANAVTTFLLILLNLALFGISSESYLAWTILGCVALALSLFFAYRQGMDFGHHACGILETVKKTSAPDSPAHGQLDEKVLKQAWSVNRGIRGMLLSALIPYLLGCAYILSSLLKIEPLELPLRLVSWVVACPFWPPVLPFDSTFDHLTGTAAAVLMISPFIIPACSFAGYMQGPKLWAKSEKAMAEGKRRAKAKSRVVRKRAPRVQKPEI